jgi:sugar-specific transcriptional regulator TrmB
LLNQEEFIEALVELGLTHLQAKVYVALVELKSATARDIHRFSNVARQDVYRLLSELEEKDLIERIIAKPTKFRSIPPNDTISILLQRRREKNRSLGKKAIRVFQKLDKNIETSFPDMGAQFILLSKSETNPIAHINRMEEAVDKAKTSVLGLTTLQLFMQIKYTHEQIWKKAVKRGVKLKFILYDAATINRNKLDLDPALRNTDDFKIRWASTPSPASVLLVDEREAFFRTGIDPKSPVLFSTDPFFVAMIKDYFEMKWKSLKGSQEQSSLSKQCGNAL